MCYDAGTSRLTKWIRAGVNVLCKRCPILSHTNPWRSVGGTALMEIRAAATSLQSAHIAERLAGIVAQAATNRKGTFLSTRYSAGWLFTSI